MPINLISCVSLPPATILSVPIIDFAIANEELAIMNTEVYYSCCGKSLCKGCIYSFREYGNIATCPFCKDERLSKTGEERVEQMLKRVEANDAGAMCALGSDYYLGKGLQQDRAKAVELWKQAAALGSSRSHFQLGAYYHNIGDSKKEKFHYEAAAMAGNEVARFNIGCTEKLSGNLERAVKHCMIAASAGHHTSMHNLLTLFVQGLVSRDAIDLTLTAYNNSCTEMRSEARDAFIRKTISNDSIGGRVRGW
jgi:TPR repeat protein